MLNAEYFKDKIEKFPEDMSIAVKDGKICNCDDISCYGCNLFEEGNNCRTALAKWLCQEYEESKINLPKDIKVDTPILVSQNGEYWSCAHLHKVEGPMVWAWVEGRTSFTADFSKSWKYAKLPESEVNND